MEKYGFLSSLLKIEVLSLVSLMVIIDCSQVAGTPLDCSQQFTVFCFAL